jgi:hypothetical protein
MLCSLLCDTDNFKANKIIIKLTYFNVILHNTIGLYQYKKHIFHDFLQMGSQFSSIPSKTAIEKRLLVKVIKATSLGAKKGNHLYNYILYNSKCYFFLFSELYKQ